MASDDGNKHKEVVSKQQHEAIVNQLAGDREQMHNAIDRLYDTVLANVEGKIEVAVEEWRSAPQVAAAKAAVKQAESLVDMAPDLLQGSDADLMKRAAEMVEEIEKLLVMREETLTVLAPALAFRLDPAPVHAALQQLLAAAEEAAVTAAESVVSE